MELKKEFDVEHLSMGDLLRAEVAKGSESGKMMDAFIKDGKLVPTELTLSILCQAIVSSPKNIVLLDGFPRSLDQLELPENGRGP